MRHVRTIRLGARRLAQAVGVVVAAFFVTALLTAPALAQEPIPTNDGWVTDLAGFLTPQEEQSLEQLMASYKAGSGNEIALLTVPNLGDRSLESLALETARAWGIGEEGRHNAALLLVARQERKVRIEVGRGLEGNLTDSISGRIIRNVITPRFKQARFHEGLREGIAAMHAAAGGDYGSIPRNRGKRGSGSVSLFYVFFFVMLILNVLRGLRGRGGRGGRGGRTGGLLPWLLIGGLVSGGGRHSSGWHGGGSGGFGGFGGGGGFSGGGASGGW